MLQRIEQRIEQLTGGPGLFSEEVDAGSRLLLGNMPMIFHMPNMPARCFNSPKSGRVASDGFPGEARSGKKAAKL